MAVTIRIITFLLRNIMIRGIIMENLRNYMQRGTPDCPIDVYCSLRGSRHRTFTHWHPELEILYVEEGSSIYRLDKQTVSLQPGDILIIAPGTIHGQQAYSPVNNVWSMVISPEAISMPPTHIFQREFVEPLQQDKLILPTLLHPGDPAHTALLPHVQRLRSCWIYVDNYKMNRFSVAMAICTALLPFCCTAAGQNPAVGQKHRAVRDCMRHIHRNYHRPLTLATLAERVHLQPNYLCALFKEHTGQTVMEHLTRIRVDAAAYLLRNSDLPMSRIAEQSGFRSESVFFTRFKALMGQTPNAYRKQHRTTGLLSDAAFSEAYPPDHTAPSQTDSPAPTE